VLRLLTPLVDSLDWSSSSNFIEALFKGTIFQFAADFGHKGTIEKALQLFDTLILLRVIEQLSQQILSLLCTLFQCNMVRHKIMNLC